MHMYRVVEEECGACAVTSGLGHLEVGTTSQSLGKPLLRNWKVICNSLCLCVCVCVFQQLQSIFISIFGQLL